MLVYSPADQARENQIKNRGKPGEWFAHRADYRPPPPAPRLRYQGLHVAEKNQPTIQSTLYTYQAKEEPPPAPVRLRTDEAVQIADRFLHQDDKWFDFEGNYAFQPKTKNRKHFTETAIQIAESNDQTRSHDWYKHQGDRSKEPSQKPPSGRSVGVRCTTVQGQEIYRNMMKTSVPDCMRQNVASKGSGNRSMRQRSSSLPNSPRDLPPRTRPEGMRNAEKNRGSASSWSVHHTVKDDGDLEVTGQPVHCNTREAVSNWSRARGRDMARCFNYTNTKDGTPRPVPRVQGTGVEYMERNQKGYIGLANEGRAVIRSHSASAAVRMRPEGERIAEKNKSRIGDCFDQAKNRNYESPRPQPRLRTTVAEAVAERNKGQMSTVIGGGTEYFPPPPPQTLHPRGIPKGVAESNHERAKGSSMKELVENYRLPPEGAPKRRVAAWGEEIAERDYSSSELKGLFSNYGRLPPEEGPRRRIRPENEHIEQKHTEDHIFDVMHTH